MLYDIPNLFTAAGLLFAISPVLSIDTMEQQPAVLDPVVPCATAPSPSSTPRKAVPVQTPSRLSQTTQLTGEGIRRELSGRELNLFPSLMSPSSLVTTPGEHELSAEGQGMGQARSPPPEDTQAVARQAGSGREAPR